MKSILKVTFLHGILLGFFLITDLAQVSFAAGTDQYDYPELVVVPRASDRIRTESEKEPSSQWTTFLPIQVSALTTMSAGIVSLGTNSTGAGFVGLGVGAAWLGASVFLATSYQPYANANKEVAKMSKGSTREQLTRERYAEEELRKISAMGQRLRWLSWVSNVGSAVYMLAQGGTSSSAGTGFNVAAIVASFTPLIFDFHWHDVYLDQREYKKKIYAPVATPTFFSDPVSQKPIPGMALSFRF